MAKRKAGAVKQPSAARYEVAYPRGLNLRAGPGMSFPVLRVLPAGDVVAAAGSARDGWLPVDEGWCDKRYLREV